MTLRVAIYARYSSDRQSDRSIEDQVRICEARIAQEGWQAVGTYTDAAISGSSTARPGYQSLMRDMREGRFDVVLSEALDRISRDQEDIAGFYKQAQFANVVTITLSEGEISELHIGLKGTMNALFLKDLASKTKRGLEGRVRQGRSGGGNAYGYEVIREFGPNGSIDRGRRKIIPAQAQIVRRIFTDYLNGKSPRAIAHDLNKGSVKGPRSSGWTASTIIGNRKRGTGILNNELYIGRLVWNRQAYIKDPSSGKRQARLNPSSLWVIQTVEQLRIIEQDAWDLVQAAQLKRIRNTRPECEVKTPKVDGAHRRPKHLFSGNIICGSCGGGMTLISRTYYGCSARKNKGTCTNKKTVELSVLENTVLSVLQTRLLNHDLTEAFMREYVFEINKRRATASQDANTSRARSVLLAKNIDHIVDAIAAGHCSNALTVKLEQLEAELAALKKQSEQVAPTAVRLHPNLAEHYASLVSSLRDHLNNADYKDEAATVLRGLIDNIIVQPTEEGIEIDIAGNLASMLTLSLETQKAPRRERCDSTILLVAGTHNRRCLTTINC